MKMMNNDVLVKLLDIESERRKIIANNLANLDTPGYKTARLNFQDALSEALADDSSNAKMETDVVHPQYSDAGEDGNDVTLGREVVAMNQNSLRTEAYLAYLKFRKSQMRAAIDGR